jgi:hypothetical protein
MIVEVMDTRAFAGIPPTMFEGIPILPLFKETPADAWLFSMEHDECELIHGKRLRKALVVQILVMTHCPFSLIRAP